MKRSWLFSILISLTAALGITDALAAGKPDAKAPRHRWVGPIPVR